MGHNSKLEQRSNFSVDTLQCAKISLENLPSWSQNFSRGHTFTSVSIMGSPEDHRPVRHCADVKALKRKRKYRKALMNKLKMKLKKDQTEYSSMQTGISSRARSSEEKMIGDYSEVSAMLSRTNSPEGPVTQTLRDRNEEISESSQEDIEFIAVNKRDPQEASEKLRTSSTNDNNLKAIHVDPDVNKTEEHNKVLNSFNLEHYDSSSGSGNDSGVAEQEVIISSDSDPEQSEPTVSVSPGEHDSTKSQVSKKSYGVAKRVKSNALARRKAFHGHSLRNTLHGSRLLLKKKLARGRTGKKITKRTPTFKISTLGADNVPMEVLVKKKLNFVFEDLSSPANAHRKAATPVNDKFNFVSSNTSAQNVVSCQLPCDLSSGADKSEKFHLISKEVENPSKSFSSNERDICYIFALLDREKDEALFKCSPQFKSSQFLQQINSVIERIAADDDVMLSRKANSSETAVDMPNEKVPVIDRASSPIVGIKSPETVVADKDGQGCASDADKDGQGYASDAHKSTTEQLVVVNTTIKVLLSKALLSFTTELKILADISIRLLSWCSAGAQGDIDSDMVEDELEAFFCLSHDQVSILLDCLSFLDSKQILNVDEAELERFWLLHDALCCMLQVYRHLQSSWSSSSIDQQLLSLLSTCSKMILPRGRLSVEKWTDLMKMVRGIGRKFSESECLSDPCKCYKCFASLRKNRFCRVCDVGRLHEVLCLAEKSPNLMNGSIGESKGMPSSKTVLEKLFPRFCLFLNSIEEWSDEEFKTAIAKHSVVKFSCNMDSGLYPCNLHLSEVACRCFASHSPSPTAEVNSSCLNVNSEGSSSPDTSDHQNSVPPMHVDNRRLPSVTKLAVEQKNADEDVDLHISSSSDLILPESKGEGKPDEINASNLPAVDSKDKNCQEQHDTSNKSIETITLDGSSSSADNFTLHIAQSSSESDQEGSNHQHSEIEQSEICNNTNSNTDIISSTGCMKSALKYVVQEEDSSVDSSLSPSIIPPSPVISMNCDQSVIMKNVSGDDSVFSISSEDLAREESTFGNKGSITSSEATQDNTEPSGVLQNSQGRYLSVGTVSPNCFNSSTSTIRASPTSVESEVSSTSIPEVPKRRLHGINHNAVQSKLSLQQAQAARNRLSESVCPLHILNRIVNHEEMKNRESSKDVNQKNVESCEQSIKQANTQQRCGWSVCAGGASSVSLAKREHKAKPHKKLQLRKKVSVFSDCNQQQSGGYLAFSDSETPAVVNEDAVDQTNDSLQKIMKKINAIVAGKAENDDLNQKHRTIDNTNNEARIVTDKNDKSKVHSSVEHGKKGKKRVKFAMDCEPMMKRNMTASERVALLTKFTDSTSNKEETDFRKDREKYKEKEVEDSDTNTFRSSRTKDSNENTKTGIKAKEGKKMRVIEEERIFEEETRAKKSGGACHLPDVDEEGSRSHCIMAAACHTSVSAVSWSGSKNTSRKRGYAVDQTSLMAPKTGKEEPKCNFAERKSLLPLKLKPKTTSEDAPENGAQNQKKKKSSDPACDVEDNADFKSYWLKHKKSKKAASPDLNNSSDWNSFIQGMRERYLQKPFVPL